MLGHDPPGGGADHTGRFHIGGFLDTDHLGANRAEVLRNVDHGDRNARSQDAAPQAGLPVGDHDGHQNGEQQRGEGVDGVGDHHQHTVHPATEIARDQAQHHAGEDGKQHGHDDGDHGGARAPHHTGEHVEATGGGAPDVFGAGGGLRREGDAVGVLDLRMAVGGDQRREDGHQQEEGGQRQAGDQHGFLPSDRDAQLLDDRDLGPQRRAGVDVELVQAFVARHGDFVCGCVGHVSTSLSGR